MDNIVSGAYNMLTKSLPEVHSKREYLFDFQI